MATESTVGLSAGDSSAVGVGRMALVLDTTVGGANANSYCSLADADTYHDSHPYATVWNAATDDMKRRALVTATRILDRQVDWVGFVIDDVQRLLWPRTGAYYRNTYNIPVTVIPADVSDATAELARGILAEDRMADNAVETGKVTSLSVAGVSISFGDVQAKVIPDSTYFMIDYLGYIKSRGGDFKDVERA